MAQGISLLFLINIITTIDGLTTIGKIRSAAYIPNNFTNVELYNGTCSECICYAFISNQSATHEALNCYTENKTCYLFRKFLPSSHIRNNTNSTVVFRSLPTNTTTGIVLFSILHSNHIGASMFDEKEREKNFAYSKCSLPREEDLYRSIVFN